MKNFRLTGCLFSVLFILMFAPAAFGQFCTVPYAPPKKDPPKPPSCKCDPPVCKKCTSSPVFAASGIYQTDAVDLTIPTSGFPLQVGRRYNSLHAIDSGTGFGWTSSFHARLHYASYLYAAPSTYRNEAEINMPDGDHYVFVQDPATGAFTPPEGRYDTLVRNGDGTFDLTLQRSHSHLQFSAEGLLTAMVDDYGNTLAFTYDGTGALQHVADISGSGRYLDLVWGPNGRISSIQDNSGRSVQYGYDTNGMLTSATNPAGQVTTYTYVPGRFSRVLSQVKDNWNRVMTDLTWDTQGRLSSYSENGETFTYGFEYGGVAAQTSKTDAGGNRWIFTVDSDGLITQRQPPSVAGAAPSYATYNSDGTIQLATDETGVKTYYTYAGQGRVASVTKDYQGSTSVRFDYTYDAAFPEKVISILPKNPATGANDPKWQGWTYDYYQAGDPAPGALHHVYRLRNDGVTADLMATYVYDTHGRVTRTTDAAASVTDYAYDPSGNLQTVTAPSNNDAGIRPVTTYGYDALGRVTSVTDALGKITTYTYDVLDRVTSVTLPKPVAGSPLNFTTAYAYDTFDAPSTLTFTDVTDPNGRVTRQGYDQFGRLRRSVDTLGNATSYAYTRDLLGSITDANGYTTSYEYDALKRLSATVFPDAARESYAYRADGLLQSKTDRKLQTISYGYDAQKRLKQKTYPNGATIQYTYQGQMLTQVVDTLNTPSETHTFAYDAQFRMTSNTQGPRGTLTYTYGVNDAVGTMTVTGGPATTYGYYPDGSLSTIEWSPVAGEFKYAYRLNGQYDTITMPSGQTRSYAYDDQGRLTQLTNAHPSAGTLAAYGYGYDVNHLAGGAMTMLGQRTSMTATVPSQSQNGAVTAYGYDNAYQLTQASYPTGPIFNGEVHNWTYDAIGNRLTSAVNGAVTSYTYQKLGTNPNNWQRLTNDGTNGYTYDANGNTVTRGGDTYGWDYENRMTSISGSVTATYKYDYQGRRTSKTVAGVTTAYLYDGLNLVRESGATATEYVFGPGIDEPLAMSGASGVSYLDVDALGSVMAANDQSGTGQNAYAYDAWGVPRVATETVAQPFRYTAREQGDLRDQWFYRARFYWSSIGRFLQEDALRLHAASRLYGYAFNAPTRYRDALGLDPTLPSCTKHDCSDYLKAGRKDLYYICVTLSMNKSPSTKCTQQCLLQYFNPTTQPVGTYPDPALGVGLTAGFGGGGSEAIDALGKLYGPVSHVSCFVKCGYGPF